MKLKQGDYVLATKYSDGDTKDHFCVGLFNGMLIQNDGKVTDRYMVIDIEGKNFRGNGFRRCEKISQKVGDILVANMNLMEEACASAWYWRYHPKQLQTLADIGIIKTGRGNKS